jgi:predicted solute-binding protein
VILLVASNSSVFLNYYLRRKKVIHVWEKKTKKKTSEKRGEKNKVLSPGDESYTLLWAEDHRVKITNLNANQQEDN